MNALAYTCQAVAPNFVWKTTDFPKAHRGHLWSIALTSILLPNIALIWYLQRRDQRRRGLLEERRQSEVSDDELDSFSLDEKKELA
jgi:ACS family pantothenate transporter-like MFS transporter